MLKNYLKIAFRSLLKDKFFSFLNVTGLAMGIACCLLIVTYVRYELSFDKHFENQESIYRVVIEGRFNGRDFTGVQNPAPAGPTFLDQIPAVEQKLRFRGTGDWIVEYQEKVFNEGDLVFTDETFFDVFKVNMIKGNPEEALTRKNHLAMSETMAKKYFGDEDPLGKTLKLDNAADWTVAGVYEDIPDNTHFHFDFLLSFITRENEYNGQQWLNQNYETYLVLNPNATTADVETQMNDIAIEHMGAELKMYLDMTFDQFKAAGNNFRYFLQPLADVHLKSAGYGGGFEPGSDITYVYIFSAIAAFILVIACINFMNLSTARSANRAKEVGIRKVLGSVRSQLIGQFISESVLITLISGLIGLGLAMLILPFFNNFASREMVIEPMQTLPALLTGALLVGFLAGLYPAFFLSAFSPVKVLKGNLSMGMKSGGLRKVLVTFQFSISILLIIGTFSILNQLQYIQNKNLGFEKDQVLLIHNSYLLGDNIAAFENKIEANPSVSQTSKTWYLPTSSSRSSTVFFPDAVIDQDKGVVSQNWNVDHDYSEVFGLKMVEGRFFSEDMPTDSMAMVINQTAAKSFGIESLDDAIIGDFNEDGSALDRYKVVGIFEDFHYESLREEIGPMILRLGQSNGYMGIKLNASNYQQVIDEARNSWDEMAPGQPFEYTFLDDRFTNMYTAETQLGDIFLIFAVLAIVIACLGLFGLAAFTAQQKTKEVGIRKVLGASISQLIYIMSREVSVLVLISFVVASAAGWYGVNQWLQGFAYRPPVSVMVFLLAGAGAFVIALLTMSYQSIKVAVANPVKALRNE
ncbi:ABC transporter permease [Roseivirga pacifica]|uniref:ABC transporter permease n=1 Tax=Roseivirga pacifica TaxID=1267423 RepID=UPI002095E24E|nr:ABC transporter permease [Roseivirga pacifica]MCO6357501.1 FtsX-like permease family protein [Roseivirga pacifica]MCO6367734.1 FtsX-like permease family protein [Roseivirga pacifica]MCO6369734.1 FtsX-like permease family protein [Roseivirga pacifica]MCO6373588.1 FtsX-like permease family protein [Roseivirga pacifica]MCO6377107.1 FtsX-like permease family protein [Roseivirga pacifica]